MPSRRDAPGTLAEEEQAQYNALTDRLSYNEFLDMLNGPRDRLPAESMSTSTRGRGRRLTPDIVDDTMLTKALYKGCQYREVIHDRGGDTWIRTILEASSEKLPQYQIPFGDLCSALVDRRKEAYMILNDGFRPPEKLREPSDMPIRM